MTGRSPPSSVIPASLTGSARSIYHHFPEGKPQLAQEAIAYAATEVGKLVMRAYNGAAEEAEGDNAAAQEVR